MQAVILAGGERHAASAAHLARRQAGRHAGRPAVHRLHARLAAPPRRRRRDPLLRLSGRRRRGGARRRLPLRRAPALRRGVRAARHRRAAARSPADLLDERFIVCNGDILTDIDLGAQLDAHERTGAVGDARAGRRSRTRSAYGLVRCDADGAVLEFVEKPTEARSGDGADQRRRLRARAQRARTDRRRAARSRSSARSGRR